MRRTSLFLPALRPIHHAAEPSFTSTLFLIHHRRTRHQDSDRSDRQQANSNTCEALHHL